MLRTRRLATLVSAPRLRRRPTRHSRATKAWARAFSYRRPWVGPGACTRAPGPGERAPRGGKARAGASRAAAAAGQDGQAEADVPVLGDTEADGEVHPEGLAVDEKPAVVGLLARAVLGPGERVRPEEGRARRPPASAQGARP